MKRFSVNAVMNPPTLLGIEMRQRVTLFLSDDNVIAKNQLHAISRCMASCEQQMKKELCGGFSLRLYDFDYEHEYAMTDEEMQQMRTDRSETFILEAHGPSEFAPGKTVLLGVWVVAAVPEPEFQQEN